MLTRDSLVRIFSQIPTLSTERLVLRRLLPTDAEDMYAYARRFEVTEFLLWYPHESCAYTKRYLEYLQGRYDMGLYYDWGITPGKDGPMIGTCGFTSLDAASNSGEVGYVLNPDHWGSGLATEAVSAVLDFGFTQLSLHRIEARYLGGNEASRRVMERCGMTFEGMARDAMRVHGVYRDVGTCAILSHEYFARKGAGG